MSATHHKSLLTKIRNFISQFAVVIIIIIVIGACWGIGNRQIINEFLTAKQDRDFAHQNLLRQREERNRSLHNAEIAKKGKMPVQVKARDELGMCKPGEYVILIDVDNQSSYTLRAPENAPATSASLTASAR